MTAYVLFGITGDLATKKILPALGSLIAQGLLPEPFVIVGVSRKPLSNEELRAYVATKTNLPATFLERIHCVSGGYDSSETYTKITEALSGTNRALFHLSVPPSAYAPILTGIADSGSAEQNPILIEKPFGTDLQSARELQTLIENRFSESQIFRIDHYLAKGGMQNLLAEKLAGEAEQNVVRIDAVIRETNDALGRGSFYDSTGALCDVLQNHLLEMLALAAMSAPRTHDIQDIRDARARVITELSPVSEEQIRRGQYEGYRDDVENPSSETETYIHIQTTLGSVPVILETGKALASSRSAVTLTFANGTARVLDMNEAPHDGALTDYARLIHDALIEDQTLFASKGEVMAAWQFVTPILEKLSSLPLISYPRGADSVYPVR